MTHSVPVQCETHNTWFPSVSFLVMLCNTNCREVKYHLWVKKKQYQLTAAQDGYALEITYRQYLIPDN